MIDQKIYCYKPGTKPGNVVLRGRKVLARLVSDDAPGCWLNASIFTSRLPARVLKLLTAPRHAHSQHVAFFASTRYLSRLTFLHLLISHLIVLNSTDTDNELLLKFTRYSYHRGSLPRSHGRLVTRLLRERVMSSPAAFGASTPAPNPYSDAGSEGQGRGSMTPTALMSRPMRREFILLFPARCESVSMMIN